MASPGGCRTRQRQHPVNQLKPIIDFPPSVFAKRELLRRSRPREVRQRDREDIVRRRALRVRVHDPDANPYNMKGLIPFPNLQDEGIITVHVLLHLLVLYPARRCCRGNERKDSKNFTLVELSTPVSDAGSG